MGDYTRTLKRVLPRHIFQPEPWRILWLLPLVAVAVAGIVAVARFDLPWGMDLALAMVIGQAFASLGLFGHEVLHGSVVRTPWLRNLAGQICLWPFAVGPRLWRRWHNVEHHGHTQEHGEDPDAMHTLEEFHARPALQYVYRIAPPVRAVLTLLALSVWFSLHSVQMLRRFLPEMPRRERPVVVAQFLLPVASWVALGAWMGFGDWVFAYLVPLLVANFTVMSYIVTNHLLSPLTPVNDPLANSLSVTVPRWVDVLHFNFSHHTEHHVFPSLSSKYAPLVKRWCKTLWPDRYHEMPHWRALWLVCTTPRVYERPTALIDPVRQQVYPVLGHGLERLARPGERAAQPVPAGLTVHGEHAHGRPGRSGRRSAPPGAGIGALRDRGGWDPGQPGC
ncbi:fatty acid desaturase [Thermaerobacter marianensis DSM 12885]|uniref:Fatty acid desaturase n=1 Tax=Thermaerobacter marianensis (strain ATCC 700841 / DSM 12885 / JCM 10246 / 7p75a) TaxID=644966 RepID=E6SJ17_THEM7|nr:fatty acid desaturase [Thermaerobacter marianensis DSM 12885]